jgi:hypothetical protein
MPVPIMTLPEEVLQIISDRPLGIILDTLRDKLRDTNTANEPQTGRCSQPSFDPGRVNGGIQPLPLTGAAMWHPHSWPYYRGSGWACYSPPSHRTRH